MLRFPSSRDMCGLHILHLKVNLLLYTCLLGALKDGILLDPSTLCTYRLELHDERAIEEVRCKRTSTPSAREAWKRRRKRGDEARIQGQAAPGEEADAPDHPGCPESRTPGCPVCSTRPTPGARSKGLGYPVPCLRAALAKRPCIFPLYPHLPLHFPWSLYTPSPPPF